MATQAQLLKAATRHSFSVEALPRVQASQNTRFEITTVHRYFVRTPHNAKRCPKEVGQISNINACHLGAPSRVVECMVPIPSVRWPIVFGYQGNPSLDSCSWRSPAFCCINLLQDGDPMHLGHWLNAQALGASLKCWYWTARYRSKMSSLPLYLKARNLRIDLATTEKYTLEREPMFDQAQ